MEQTNKILCFVCLYVPLRIGVQIGFVLILVFLQMIKKQQLLH